MRVTNQKIAQAFESLVFKRFIDVHSMREYIPRLLCDELNVNITLEDMDYPSELNEFEDWRVIAVVNIGLPITMYDLDIYYAITRNGIIITEVGYEEV